MRPFLEEVRRRNVFRVAVAYTAIAWVLIQIADIVYPAFELPSWVMQVTLVSTTVGFVVTVVLAWLYEFTPEGIKRTEDAPPEQSVARLRGRRLDFVIIGVLVLGLVFVVADHYVIEGLSPSGAHRPSLAVLPFTNISSDPEQEYFADGLTEELINSLARIGHLRVAGRTSAFYFKNKNEDLRTVGDLLHVEHVLEGSVRKAEGTVRITAQLINTHDGYQLWSKTYDRRLDDIFAIQEEIATLVAESLQITLGVGELGRRPGMTRSVEAYEEFLRGLPVDDMSRRVDHFGRAVELDPEFALAWIQLSIAYRIGSRFIPTVPREEWDSRATDALRRARGLAPESIFIRAIEAQQTAQALGDWLKAGRMYAGILDSTPSSGLEPDVALHYGRFLRFVGKSTEAVAILERARSLDPFNVDVAVDLFNAYESVGNFAAALAEADRGIALAGVDSASGLAHASLTAVLAEGAHERLDERFAIVAVADPAGFVFITRMRELLNDPVAARAELALQAAEPGNQNPQMLQRIAIWLSYFGDGNAVIEILRRPVILIRTPSMINFVVWRQVMRDVRGLPAFKDLMREAGLVDYWREFGWPDFCRPVSNDDFSCA